MAATRKEVAIMPEDYPEMIFDLWSLDSHACQTANAGRIIDPINVVLGHVEVYPTGMRARILPSA